MRSDLEHLIKNVEKIDIYEWDTCLGGIAVGLFPEQLAFNNDKIVYHKDGVYYWNYDALKMFFELTDRETDYLFKPDAYTIDPTPKEVIKHIEWVLTSSRS